MVTHRYWDACCFLGYLKAEDDKIVQCEAVIDEAQEGKLIIVTSAITLAETLYLVKGQKPVPAEIRDKVQGFFQNDYIYLAEVDRKIGEMAQEVVWDHGIKPKDAIHVATALRVGEKIPITQLDTFDNPLIQHSGKIDNLQIGAPSFQTDLMTDAAMHSSITTSIRVPINPDDQPYSAGSTHPD